MYALTCCTSRPRAQTSVEIRTRASPPLFQHDTRAQVAAEEVALYDMQLHKAEHANGQVRQSLNKPAEPTAKGDCSSQLSPTAIIQHRRIKAICASLFHQVHAAAARQRVQQGPTKHT